MVMLSKKSIIFLGVIFLLLGIIFLINPFGLITGLTISEEGKIAPNIYLGALSLVISLVILLYVTRTAPSKLEKIVVKKGEKLFVKDRKGRMRINDFLGGLKGEGVESREEANKAIIKIEDSYHKFVESYEGKKQEAKDLFYEILEPYVDAALAQRNKLAGKEEKRGTEEYYADQLNCSPKTIQREYNYLEEQGLIEIEYRNIKVNGKPYNNVPYIDINVEAIRKLTYEKLEKQEVKKDKKDECIDSSKVQIKEDQSRNYDLLKEEKLNEKKPEPEAYYVQHPKPLLCFQTYTPYIFADL